MPRKVASPKPVELDRGKGPFVILGVIVLGIVITGGTILWAKSDVGQIDVSATIAQSNITAAEDGDDNTPATPQATNEHSNMPNGGLTAQGSDVPRPPEPDPVVPEGATTTATTTEEGTEGGEPAQDDTTDTGETTDSTPDTSAPSDTTTPLEGEGVSG